MNRYVCNNCETLLSIRLHVQKCKIPRKFTHVIITVIFLLNYTKLGTISDDQFYKQVCTLCFIQRVRNCLKIYTKNVQKTAQAVLKFLLYHPNILKYSDTNNGFRLSDLQYCDIEKLQIYFGDILDERFKRINHILLVDHASRTADSLNMEPLLELDVEEHPSMEMPTFIPITVQVVTEDIAIPGTSTTSCTSTATGFIEIQGIKFFFF